MKFFIFIIILSAVSGETFASNKAIHPSNQYCLDHGGSLVSFDIDHFGGDQFGVCKLDDDSMFEAMTFWKQSQNSSIAFTNFLKANWHQYQSIAIEKWAEKNCLDLGGKILIAIPHLKPSVKYQFCEFLDKSTIETWTLMSGRDNMSNLEK